MSDFVYKGLRKRIIIATVIISVVLASIVYLTNYRQIDTSVADIARDRAERFNLVFDNLLNDPANLDPDAIRNALIKFSNTHTQNHIGEFIYVTIFDKNANAITQMAEADAEAMIEITEISKSNNDRLKSTTTTYLQSFQIDNRYHVYIQVPLWNSSGNISAIVEGIFRVSDEAINTIWTKTFLTILFAIGIVMITAIILYPVITRLTKRLARYSDALLTSNLETIKVLGSAIAKRDNDTDAHNSRVTIYAILLAKEINLDPLKIQSLIKGAFLHDVGKIGIRDNVLLKPGRLDNDEFDIMKTHVNHGNEIIAGLHY
ncbi:Response regulator [hydrothermal vent metagenome]|uniref:Response regulator n=1 Tax=hydrothermal vent metagenome TaxID=652676 RepID=A0A3B1AHH8_9ZZZZ